MEGILDTLEDEDPLVPGPPGPLRLVIVQTPQVTLDTTALEHYI